ncbi:MAG: hypothetical protein K0S65_5405 [Labilithrix sp.]|nr:hypothetical protein [Labilithrix sp.]
MSRQSTMQIWRMPIFLTVLSTVGLVVGLFADGAADVICYLSLAVPVGVTLWHVGRAMFSRPTGVATRS